MTALSDFTDDARTLLVSLPYIVGVYVSHADDVDGEDDDEREIAALEGCIKGIASMHADQPLVREIFEQTLSHKDMWAQWEEQSFHAPILAERALGFVVSVGSEGNAKNYRAALMEVASAVAQAFGEFGEFDDEPEVGFFGGIVSKVVGGLSKISEDDAGHPMNVSAAEDSAIHTLQQAMKIS